MDIKVISYWNKYLDLFLPEQKDIYYYEEYVKLYETEESKALCIVCEEEGHILLMPFLRKKIKEYFDFETAYGYGGPIVNTQDQSWITKVIVAMNTYFRENNYICGFVRFHPVLDNAIYCKEEIKVIYDRETVLMNVDESEDEIWNTQIISKNRNMIRKAEKNGLRYVAEYNFESLNEFIKLYEETMKRLNADSFYFFEKEYYLKYIERLNNQAFLGTIRKDEKLISSALFMYSENYGHYHLAGSNYEFSNLGANNYLLWNAALEMKKLGVKYFHLGGGYDCNPENSLLKFKKAFNKNTKCFAIGKFIFNKDVYDQVCMEWEYENPEKVLKYKNILLKYRY